MALHGYLLNRILISDTTLDTITALLVHSIFVNKTDDDSESGSLSEYIVLWNNKEKIKNPSKPQNGRYFIDNNVHNIHLKEPSSYQLHAALVQKDPKIALGMVCFASYFEKTCYRILKRLLGPSKCSVIR